MIFSIGESAMFSPQGRFDAWLAVFRVVTRAGQDFFDVSCVLYDEEEIRLGLAEELCQN